MKSLLKLLGTLALATTPVITVVACGSENKQMTPRDILNSAAAFITDSNLQVKADLNLPDDVNIEAMSDKIFSQLDSSVQTAITNYFADKVKESTDQHPTNWYHPDAHVKIIDVDSKDPNVNKAKFVLPTGNALVNGHLLVTAEISYSNLPPITKNITITINNDTSHSSHQIKTEKIKEFIAREIAAGRLNVNVENLPISEPLSTKESARNQLSFIQQNLNDAIKDKVQYDGLRLNFAFSGDVTGDASKSTLFTMTNSSINPKDNSIIFNGNINNITISFLIGAAGKSDIDTGAVSSDPTIKVNQTFADATTQISKIFTEWTVEPVKTLPDSSKKYSEYADRNVIEKQFIDNGYFVSINNIYNILGKNWVKNITVTNPDTHFNLNPNEKNGYFNLNFNLKYDLKSILPDTSSEFNITIENVHIKLRQI